MECRHVRELADSFLTDELLVETNHELVRHLETCPGCRADLALRRTMREKLRQAFDRAPALQPRDDLAAALVERLRPRDTLTRRSLLQSWWAIAAGLLLAVGGGTVVRDARSRARIAAIARQAAADHLNCAVKFRLAERPLALAAAAARDGAPYGALDTFTLPPALAARLLERHACVYDGRRFGHLVLHYEGALASLLVTDGPAPESAQLEADGRPAVASLPAGSFVAFVVADLDPALVLRLGESLATPLSRHLAS
jgi:predicted anti-sigma-YlaC factor YlaD